MPFMGCLWFMARSPAPQLWGSVLAQAPLFLSHVGIIILILQMRKRLREVKELPLCHKARERQNRT